jgi:hypothetical protein
MDEDKRRCEMDHEEKIDLTREEEKHRGDKSK